jgi:hypothetical protein
MTRGGFPHSEICVSTPACGSTQLIAANHVLLRLLTPRHPPSALSSLTTSLLRNNFVPLRGQDQGSLFEIPLTQRISHAPRRLRRELITQMLLRTYLTRASSSIQLSNALRRHRGG